MKTLFLDAPGALSLRDADAPTPGTGELLVRVKAATTCGTDLKAWRRGHPQIPMPGPFGHEWSGIVEAAGEGARFHPGDAVMGTHSAPCGHCRWCKKGQENLCATIMETKVLGTYADLVLIPERIAKVNVYAKPENLSFAEAALLEPLACAEQGMIELEKVGADLDRVLVIGPGAVGLMFCGLLRMIGSEVDLAGRNPERLALADHFGARAISLDEAERDYDAVIECTGSVEIWERSVEFLRRGGHAMLFGGPPAGTRASFDTHRLHYDQITLLSPFHFGTAAVRRAAQDLPEMGLGVLVTEERPLSEAERTFADLDAGRGIKYALIPGEGSR